MTVLPLFKTHYSIGKSILTLEPSRKPGESTSGPDSVFDIAKREAMKQVFLVEDSMTGYLQAMKNAGDVQVNFGLRFTVTADMSKKSEGSEEQNHRVVVFIKNTEGYKALIKFVTKAATDGFYYQPRIDLKYIKDNWNEACLKLAIPFYDSFLFQNTLTFASIVPDLSFTKPTFFVEGNQLPFDGLLIHAVERYIKANDGIAIPAKSIFYDKRQHFKAYLTARCINGRTTLNKPQLEHMCSVEFCTEAWKEQNG